MFLYSKMILLRMFSERESKVMSFGKITLYNNFTSSDLFIICTNYIKSKLKYNTDIWARASKFILELSNGSRVSSSIG